MALMSRQKAHNMYPQTRPRTNIITMKLFYYLILFSTVKLMTVSLFTQDINMNSSSFKRIDEYSTSLSGICLKYPWKSSYNSSILRRLRLKRKLSKYDKLRILRIQLISLLIRGIESSNDVKNKHGDVSNINVDEDEKVKTEEKTIEDKYLDHPESDDFSSSNEDTEKDEAIKSVVINDETTSKDDEIYANLNFEVNEDNERKKEKSPKTIDVDENSKDTEVSTLKNTRRAPNENFPVNVPEDDAASESEEAKRLSNTQWRISKEKSNEKKVRRRKKDKNNKIPKKFQNSKPQKKRKNYKNQKKMKLPRPNKRSTTNNLAKHQTS